MEVNYDLAREDSLVNPKRAFLMEWIDRGSEGWWNIINYCSNVGKWSVMLSIPRTTNKTYCVVCNGVVMAWREPLPACTWEELDLLEDLFYSGDNSYYYDERLQNLYDRGYAIELDQNEHNVRYVQITPKGIAYVNYCHANMYDGS